MAEQTVRVTARGDFTQLQRGLKQLQGDLKNVTGEIDRGARKGGFFDDSQIRALDFFGKRFKSTLQELKDAMAEHGHAFERLLSMARNAHGAERDAIQKEINYRSKIIDQLEEQISHMEKLYQQRKKDANDFDRPKSGGSSSKGGGKGSTSGNHDLGGTLLNKVMGGAQLMLGMAGIGGVMSMVSEAYRLAYERNTAPLDLSQRIRGYGGRSGGAKDMWDASGNVGRQDNMGYTNAESWQFLDMYSRQAGAPSADEQKRLMKFGRGYGLSTGEVSGLVGENVHSGGGKGSELADAIAGSVAKSGMTPRIVEVMETNNALLKSMNTTLKDGSAKQLLAYQTSLDRIGTEKGMTQLTGSNGGNIIGGLGGIFKPGQDNWKWMGIRALQQYNPKKYGKMDLFGLESTFEDGLIGKDGKPSDNVAAMSQYIKSMTGGNTETQARALQRWLTDGGFAATKTQAMQLITSGGLDSLTPDQLQKAQNGSVDSGASYDASRRGEAGQNFLQTDSRFQAALAQLGETIVQKVQELKDGATTLMEDALKLMNGDNKILGDILKFMNDHLVGLATAAGALSILQSIGLLGGVGGAGSLLSTVARLSIPLAIIAAGTVAMVEGFKFTDEFIKNGGFHPADVAKQNFKAMQGTDAPSWITDSSQLDPASPSYYRNDPRFKGSAQDTRETQLQGMTEEEKKKQLMNDVPTVGGASFGLGMPADQKIRGMMAESGDALTSDQARKLQSWLQTQQSGSYTPSTPSKNTQEEAARKEKERQDYLRMGTFTEEVGKFFTGWLNYIASGDASGAKKSSMDMSKSVEDGMGKMVASMDTFRRGATNIMLASYGGGSTGGGGLSLASLSMGGGRGMSALGHSNATSEQLDSKLGGALGGYGRAFAAAGQKYGLDPTFLAAVAMHETGNGTSSAINDRNNVGGMMGKNGLMNFGSIYEGIDAMASNLKRNYIDQGLTSIDQIQKKYAPLGADNDPTNLNSNWTSGVERYMGILNDDQLAKPLQGAGNGDAKTASTKHESTVNVILTGEGADQLTNLSKEQLIRLIKTTWVEQERQRKLTSPTKAVMA